MSTITITETAAEVKVAKVPLTSASADTPVSSSTAKPSVSAGETKFLNNSPASSPLPLRYVVPKKFDINNDDQLTAALEHLRVEGYAVLSNVAVKHQVDFLLELFWQYVAQVNPAIKRDDPTTWNDEAWPGVGIFRFLGIGQSPFLWAARTLPNIRKFYERLYGTDKLLVSFDGCGTFRPLPHAYTAKSWLHSDQNPRRQDVNKFVSVQGLLNLMPQTDGPQAHGAFICIPKSHTWFKQRYAAGLERELVMRDTHFLLLPPGHPIMAAVVSGGQYAEAAREAAAATAAAAASTVVEVPAKKKKGPKGSEVKLGADPVKDMVAKARASPYDSELTPIALNVAPGDFIVWDSCTIHANIAPLPSDAQIAESKSVAASANLLSTLRRLVAYVCMAPLSQVPLINTDGTPDARGSGASNVDTLEPPTYEQFVMGRRLACANAYTTSHWPTQWPILDNALGRVKTGAKSIPAGCRKSTFTSGELALLTGATPASNNP